MALTAGIQGVRVRGEETRVEAYVSIGGPWMGGVTSRTSRYTSGRSCSSIMPAATVSFEASSMRMKAPVARFVR